MVKKKKTSRYNRKRTKSRVGSDNQLEGLTHHYRDIQWFWQFLKLAVDYEGKVLNVRGRLVWEGGHKRKGHKFRQGRSTNKGIRLTKNFYDKEDHKLERKLPHNVEIFDVYANENPKNKGFGEKLIKQER